MDENEAARRQLASIKELHAAGKPLLHSDFDWLIEIAGNLLHIGKAGADRIAKIEEHLTDHQDIHEDDGWWLLGQIKRVKWPSED